MDHVCKKYPISIEWSVLVSVTSYKAFYPFLFYLELENLLFFHQNPSTSIRTKKAFRKSYFESFDISVAAINYKRGRTELVCIESLQLYKIETFQKHFFHFFYKFYWCVLSFGVFNFHFISIMDSMSLINFFSKYFRITNAHDTLITWSPHSFFNMSSWRYLFSIYQVVAPVDNPWLKCGWI